MGLFRAIHWIAAFAFFTSFSAGADTLLIISDGEGMYGGNQMNLAMEHFGGELAASAISKNYRKTYQWFDSEGIPFDSLWTKILSERQPGEPIDVFAMEHGSDGMPLSQLDDLSSVPTGFIRRFFSTGCSNWGDFTAAPDGSALKIDDFDQTNHDSFKDLGIQEYIVHGNTNAPLLEIPLLLSRFRDGGSWLTEAAKAYDLSDSLLASVLPKLTGISSADSGSDFSDWNLLLVSRPVLGGTALNSKRSQIFARDMLAELPEHSDEMMLAPNPSLARALTKNCPDAFAGAETDLCVSTDQGASLSAGIQAAALLFEKLFETYSFDKTGCVDTVPFQALIDHMLTRADGQSPKLESLCVERASDQDVKLRWSLGPTPEGAELVRAGLNAENVRNTDFWEVSIPSDLTDLEGLTVSQLILGRDGEVRVHSKKGEVNADISGVDISAEIEGFEGPKFLERHVGIDRFTIRDNGSYAVHLEAPILGLPVSVSGNQSDAQALTLRVLGIPFQLE